MRKISSILFFAMAIKLALICLAYALPVSVLDLLGVTSLDHGVLINYAPEIWLSLLALVFGTLIIVVSIASENTPKLIDLFVGDPRGRLYIWLIMLSSLENIYLQLFSPRPTIFLANVIFINSYVLLPCFILLAIPYTFYILKYTKNANVIERIYKENMQALMASKHAKAADIERNHIILFETINQLHDLLQYIQFKEPKGDIINKMGKSVRTYLELKRTFPDSYFKLNDRIKNDISFRTLSEKYDQIENEKTFYEQKVLRVLGTTYLLLIKDSHYELASLCGDELFEIGKLATDLDDQPVINAVTIHFNTFLRYGINQGMKSREIRNVYNAIFHYSQLVHLFIEKREEKRILQCCQYFGLYANEVGKLSVSEPLFVFLIEAFSWELKKVLVSLHANEYSRELQEMVLLIFTGLSEENGKPPIRQRNERNGVRLIQIALCLFYTAVDEVEFNDITINSIARDLVNLSERDVKELLARNCDWLNEETQEFWEETDQGNRNIFYSRDKNQISKFKSYFFSKMNDNQFNNK